MTPRITAKTGAVLVKMELTVTLFTLKEINQDNIAIVIQKDPATISRQSCLLMIRISFRLKKSITIPITINGPRHLISAADTALASINALSLEKFPIPQKSPAKALNATPKI